MPLTLANGKICYLEIPSDIAGSADFYKRARLESGNGVMATLFSTPDR
jgi:hypothetical protein